MTSIALGVVLIIIAIILAAAQHFNMYNFYGSKDNQLYFWALVIIIGIIGIILAAWTYVKKETPQKPA